MKMGAAGLASLALDRLGPPSFGGRARGRASGAPWKFGVMADTQWRRNLDGKNPGTVAVGIIDALNAEFVRRGVRLVIQVGDLVDVEYDAPNGDASRRTMPFRAAAAERLYEAGIGFFPLRGNHEASATAANELVSLYPQSRGVGDRVFGADDFSSPFAALEGLSYLLRPRQRALRAPRPVHAERWHEPPRDRRPQPPRPAALDRGAARDQAVGPRTPSCSATRT